LSQKEKFLSRLDDTELLELAKSVSKDQIDSRIGRSDLIKIVKAYLSLEEIKQKVNGTGNPVKISAPRGKAFTLGGAGQVFFVLYGIAALIFMSLPPTLYYGMLIGSVAVIRGGALFASAEASLPMVFVVLNGEASLLMVFAVLNMISMTALRKELSGNKTGLISGSIALAYSTLAMVYSIATTYANTVTPPGLNEPPNYYLLGTLQVFTSVLMTLTLALIGVFFVVHYRHLPGGDISLVAGFVYAFAGILYFYFLLGYGFYFAYLFPFESPLSIVAGSLGAACYLAHKTR
jgi:hypothetical protein